MFRLPARAVIVVSAVLGATLFTGCSDLSSRVSAPDNQQARLSALRAQDVREAITAQERHTAALMRIKGVVGTAVGLLPDGRAAVQIYVVDNTPRSIPAALDGVPVDLRVSGMIMALSDPTTLLRPAPMGYSVGHPAITAGTLGARAVAASDATKLFILSNNHVLANSNDAVIGDPTLQPGSFDGGTLADQVGTLYAFKPIDFSGGNNTIDAAISLTSALNVLNSTPTDDGYGQPSGKIYGDANNDRVFDNVNALLGLNVEKYGRTTKLTFGQITGINASVTVCYEVLIIFCIKSANYVDQLIITPGTFSGGGDSGSLIVSNDGNRNPVALLFAGSSAQTIGNRIDLVLNYFNVDVDGSQATPVTDVAVASVSAPSSVVAGTTASVSVTVSNVGNQSVGTFDVSLADQPDNVAIGTQTVAGLAGGASTTLSFAWNTASSTLGGHTLVGSASLTDDNGANNQKSTSVQVAGPTTDVAVSGVSAPASVLKGQTASVSVTVSNVGNQNAGTFDVSLQDETDNAALGTQTVAGLAAGASATLTFSWNTTSSSVGPHTLLGSHTLADDNAANNQASTSSQVTQISNDIHVGDLDGSASRGSNSWSATVEITIHDSNHQPINGATVNGTWTPAGLASDQCTTGDLGGNGTCIVLFPSVGKSTKNVRFTVTSVTMPGRTYQPTQNHDPDGSSNGTAQVVSRP